MRRALVQFLYPEDPCAGERSDSCPLAIGASRTASLSAFLAKGLSLWDRVCAFLIWARGFWMVHGVPWGERIWQLRDGIELLCAMDVQGGFPHVPYSRNALESWGCGGTDGRVEGWKGGVWGDSSLLYLGVQKSQGPTTGYTNSYPQSVSSPPQGCATYPIGDMPHIPLEICAHIPFGVHTHTPHGGAPPASPFRSCASSQSPNPQKVFPPHPKKKSPHHISSSRFPYGARRNPNSANLRRW